MSMSATSASLPEKIRIWVRSAASGGRKPHAAAAEQHDRRRAVGCLGDERAADVISIARSGARTTRS